MSQTLGPTTVPTTMAAPSRRVDPGVVGRMGPAPVREGDEPTMGAALAAHRPYLAKLAHGLLSDRSPACIGVDDLVQETFLAAWRDLDTFRGATGAEFRAWLKTALIRQEANARRRSRALRRGGHLAPPAGGYDVDALPGAVTPVSRAVRRRQRREALLLAISGLPPHYREVVAGRYLHGLGFAELAARRGTSEEAVRKLWARALIRLRASLGEGYDPDTD